MQKVEYPKFKYHATREPVIVKSLEQEKKLKGEWFESPADIKVKPKRKRGRPRKWEQPET